MSKARDRAKRAEIELRKLAGPTGLFFPRRGVAFWRKGKKPRDGAEGDTVDSSGVDYWGYPYGAALPFEVKHTHVPLSTWNSKRNPIVLYRNRISEAQERQMDEWDGYLYARFSTEPRTGSRSRSIIVARILAPWRVWKSLLQGTGWRREDINTLSQMGYELTMYKEEFVPDYGTFAIGYDAVMRNVIAAARLAVINCENTVTIADETGDPEVTEKVEEICWVAQQQYSIAAKMFPDSVAVERLGYMLKNAGYLQEV